MSETFEINIADFTASQLDDAIAQLKAVATQVGKEVEVAETFKNKKEQGAAINALMAATEMRPIVVTEAEMEQFKDTPVKVGDVVLISLNDSEDEETTNDGEGAEGDDNADGAGEGEGEAAGGNDGADDEEKDDTPSKENNEPVRATGEQRYKGELITNINNKIMNGRMYVEVFTIQASYVLTPEEAKEAGISTKSK